MIRIIRFSTIILLLLILAGCSKQDESMIDDGSESFGLVDASLFGDGENNGNGQNAEPGVLTAGEWNDLSNWAFWTDLVEENEYYQHLEYWNIFPLHRYEVKLSDPKQNPIADARVILQDKDGIKIWEARTDNTGSTQLWSKTFGDTDVANNILIKFQGSSFSFNNVTSFNEGINELIIDVNKEISYNADIMFVVDATGSMGDEIDYLKTELEDVINRVGNMNPNLNLNLGSVFYRDTQDAYITKVQAFTDNVNELINFIGDQQAAGGGDYPEAVHAALKEALAQQWSETANGRLLFLILDAPPHYEPAVLDEIQTYVKTASEKGIKIIPVSASGIDIQTEFLMRSMAILSNGTYTFITDHSGVGNDHLEPTVGEYQVELLNDLLVRLISEQTSF